MATSVVVNKKASSSIQQSRCKRPNDNRRAEPNKTDITSSNELAHQNYYDRHLRENGQYGKNKGNRGHMCKIYHNRVAAVPA